jgi:hypothetical protein
MILLEATPPRRSATLEQEEIDMMDIATPDMTTGEANATLILSGYAAFRRGDIPSALAVFAENIFWHVPGRGPLSRDYTDTPKCWDFSSTS